MNSSSIRPVIKLPFGQALKTYWWILTSKSGEAMVFVMLTVAMLLLARPEIEAQEHLEPEHGVFSVWTAAYQERIREIFAEGYRYDVLLKAIILDSSSTESLIAVRESLAGLETVHLVATTDIWNSSFLPQPDGSRRSENFPGPYCRRTASYV